MNWKEEYKSFLWISAFFLAAYFMPLSSAEFKEALFSAFELLRWYAQEHVLLCLIPAFFIAGVIAVFVNQAAVIKYFGAGTKKWISYAIASVSGTVLAVCSCTILPLFAGIYKRGAGLGPAVTFLYAGPAINILGIILTIRILGLEIGIVRIIGAVIFAAAIGLIMNFIYGREESVKAEAQIAMPEQEEVRPLWQTASHFFILVLIMIFASLAGPDEESGFWNFLFTYKWHITAMFGLAMAGSLFYILKLNAWHVGSGTVLVMISCIIWPDNPAVPFTAGILALTVILSVSKGEANEWMAESWGFAKQILPLLAAGVLLAGFFLGSQEGGRGIIPAYWISGLAGGNSLAANFFASVTGAFMYFATLTEIPILQGLLSAGMGKGPALALLLAGPAVSLPNMLVIRSVIGTQKTVVYIALVIIMSTASGLMYGLLF